MATLQGVSVLAWSMLVVSINVHPAQQRAHRPLGQLENKIEDLKALKQNLATATPAREQAIHDLSLQANRDIKRAKYSLAGMLASLVGAAFSVLTFHTTLQDRMSRGVPSKQPNTRPKLPPPTKKEVGSVFAGFACILSAVGMLAHSLGSLVQSFKRRLTIHNLKTECPTNLVTYKIELLEQLKISNGSFSTLEQLINRTAETCNWPSKRKAIIRALVATKRDLDFTSMQAEIIRNRERAAAA